VRRFTPLLFLVALAAGCGSAKHAATTTQATTTEASPATGVPGSRVLYAGGNWAVVLKGDTATVVHLVGAAWRSDTSNRVKIQVLGPAPGSKAPSLPQIAAQLTSPAPGLVESGLWVDGMPLDVKGGGTPRRATIYGAPPKPLTAGRHVAIAYGRTSATGTAEAWSFTTP
jgi:hypothetical protein